MRKFLLIVTIVLILLTTNRAIAQELSPTPTPTPEIIKYDLAFPGILPDNPLYKLKILRDKISASLISDPKKKVEYYLLQTDKGILASAILVDKNKVDLAKETALKAENNMTLLTYELGNLPNKTNDPLFDKLKTASLKHQEVLRGLVKRVPEKDRNTFQTVIDFSKRNWKTIEDFQKYQGLPQK